MSTTAVWGVAAGAALVAGRRRCGAWSCVSILATALAGVILGVHWPTDVIAGTIIGAGAAALAARVVGRVTT